MTQDQLERYINELIDKNELWRFYKSKEWMQLKEEVLQEHHYECYMCRQQGKITKADCVHHDMRVRDYPRLALSKTYIDKEGNEQINLMPLCNKDHNRVHYNEKIGKSNKENKDEINQERW